MESRYLEQTDTALLPQPLQTSEQDAPVQVAPVSLVDISDSPAQGVCSIDGVCS